MSEHPDHEHLTPMAIKVMAAPIAGRVIMAVMRQCDGRCIADVSNVMNEIATLCVLFGHSALVQTNPEGVVPALTTVAASVAAAIVAREGQVKAIGTIIEPMMPPPSTPDPRLN